MTIFEDTGNFKKKIKIQRERGEFEIFKNFHTKKNEKTIYKKIQKI